MIKNDIEYNGKSYQVSTIDLHWGYETMIFPVIDGVVSGSEVYKYRTCLKSDSEDKHFDIVKHPKKYLDENCIEEYKKSLEEDFKLTDIEKFKNFFDEMGINYREYKYDRTHACVLEIDKEHIYTGYFNELSINFNLDTGDFIEFEPWGE